jgi:hypothetical protein
VWIEECVYKNNTELRINVSGTPLGIAYPTLYNASIDNCKGWNRTEYCGGYFGAAYGYCAAGKCVKKHSACKYINSTHMDSKCIREFITDENSGEIRTLSYIVNCTDVDGDGSYEWDMHNFSGMKTWCRWGCNTTFNATIGNVSYAECHGFADIPSTYKNIIAEYTEWFRILFPADEPMNRIIFSVMFLLLVGSFMTLKISWEMGLTSIICSMLVFMAIGFIPFYGLLIVLSLSMLYLYKELSE